MIESIHGILEACRADQAIIRVGGFSIRVFAPSSTLQRLNETGMEVTLHTHFHVRGRCMVFLLKKSGTHLSSLSP